MHIYVVGIIIDCLELILFFIGLYYVLAGVFAFAKKADIPEADGKLRRFAVIVPAHNEGTVIGQLLQSISQQQYPKNRMDVFVVADGCTDNTAQIANACGAYVLTRNGEAKGKAKAVECGISHILSLDAVYDCVAIFDADNILRRDCIFRINDMLGCGYEVVQCRVDAKNHDENWLTAAYSVWHILESRFGKLGCHNLGMGCKLSGTGFAINTDVLEKCPWDCDSMAEDLEYTMKLGLKGIKPGFANKAVVYDEKPSSFKTSVMQRCRWAQGIVDVQGRYGWTLLRRRKFGLWLSLYGDFLGQFTYALFLVISVFSNVSIIFDYSFPLCGLWVQPVAYAALNIYLGIGAFCAFAGLVIDKKLNRYTIFNLFGFMLYMLSWIPIGIAGAFRHNKKEWYHTEHTGSL